MQLLGLLVAASGIATWVLRRWIGDLIVDTAIRLLPPPARPQLRGSSAGLRDHLSYAHGAIGMLVTALGVLIVAGVVRP